MPPKFSSRVPWREKLERQQQARIVDIPPRMQGRLGKGRMIIPRPLDVDALIRRVPKGKLVTVFQLRQELARRNAVDTACPPAREFLSGLQPKPRMKIAARERKKLRHFGA
jgi:hypothetical protein